MLNSNNEAQQHSARTYLGSNEGHQAQAPVKTNTPPTSASITKGVVNPVQTRVEAQDILNMSDEEFEQFQRTVKFIKQRNNMPELNPIPQQAYVPTSTHNTDTWTHVVICIMTHKVFMVVQNNQLLVCNRLLHKHII